MKFLLSTVLIWSLVITSIQVVAQNETTQEIKKAEKEKAFSKKYPQLQKISSPPSTMDAQKEIQKETTTNTKNGQLKSGNQTPLSEETALLKKNGISVETCKLLGLDPLSATPEEYRAAKEKLYYESPEKYAALKKAAQDMNQSNNTQQKGSISRRKYTNLSAEQKSFIDAHPERYQIVD